MNQREARIIALGGLTAVASLGADGMGDAFPQNRADGQEWTEAEFYKIRAAFEVLQDELAVRLARLEGRR